MKCALLCILLSAGAVASGQSSSAAPADRDNLGKLSPAWTEEPQDFNKPPSPRDVLAAPLDRPAETTLSLSGISEIHPKMIVRPAMQLGAQRTLMAQNLSSGLRLRPIESPQLPADPLSTVWPRRQIEPIPTDWPNFRLEPVDANARPVAKPPVK
jgi:hypothetical protein